MASAAYSVLIPSIYLTGTAVALYPQGLGSAQITKLTALNTHTGADTITVHIVPSGGTVLPDNMIVKAKIINAAYTDLLPELQGHVLGNGDTLYAFAGTTGHITLRVSGIKFT